jgi:hypothetical protein
MLCSQNSGKYLTKEWEKERERCIENSSGYPDGLRLFYEVNNTGIYDGCGYQRDMNLKIENSPIDPRTQRRELDHRDRPEVGH